MAKDPAFLFYPGDYLRDTQNLGEAAQVAYDRIMCEHMRNICITQQQLNFFTKRMSDDEKDELMFVIEECEGGFHIPWVSESITKRRAYSESRRNNRKGKKKKNTSKTYVKHMENEIENENKDDIEYPYTSNVFLNKWKDWKAHRKAFDKFKYTPQSEKAALTKLQKLAKSEARAIAIIDQSIEKGWKGFFPLKQEDEPKTHVMPTPEDVLKVFPGVLKSFSAD